MAAVVDRAHAGRQVRQVGQGVGEGVDGVLQLHRTDHRIRRLLGEVEGARSAGDGDRLTRGDDVSEEGRLPVSGHAADHHHGDGGLGGLDQVAVGRGRATGDDDEIGQPSRRQRAEEVAPAEDAGRVGRHHGHQVFVGQVPTRRVGMQSGHLQLAEQVLAARRRPVGAERDAHTLLAGGGDVGGLAVEQARLLKGRPHHRCRRRSASDRKSAGPSAGAVDAGQCGRDGPVLRRRCARPRSGRARPARCPRSGGAAVVDGPSSCLQEGLGGALVDVGDLGVGARGGRGSPGCSTLRTTPGSGGGCGRWSGG